MKNITTREELKTYFETGDRPTEGEFSELIDSYVHLKELNFGLTLRSSAETYNKYYDFYRSENLPNTSVGHLIVESVEGREPENIHGYTHILGQTVLYKKMHITLEGLDGVADIMEYEPKVIIKRYKQKKKLKSGNMRKAHFAQEREMDAKQWNRKSVYVIDAKESVLDLEPIHYFKPNYEGEYKGFSPSGSRFKPGDFKFTTHGKPFVPAQIMLEIMINGRPYRSLPVAFKIVLGSSGPGDAINYIVG
ncbi:hypothetical protein E6C50_17185 [Flavobacterium supellecticarium]|uniref:Uncharacterized protein n=1 Tax=Flavobacterium supellecticarium TaxID=2565924 RepID=A0A4S3ZP95_9FLAO|nr:hypothetical protein [Flavobacterium supellecticarium]THF47299.1 hypothetical protein E6C50_17185 [Flavobacterium supellecticarium]